ncbi:30S ribosomal protein S11, partial [Patescibacteria group bacterium]|nr:30S ribosomal protein S11 [Patescibacteria group bacterium]
MPPTAKQSTTSRKKKASRKNVGLGIVYILATFNNTHVSMTDSGGNVLAWQSSGASGFKGARKSTPYAATQVAQAVLEKIKPMGVTHVEIRVS